MRSHPRAELAVAAPQGMPGEGSWYVHLDGGLCVVAVVQPSKDIPGETWIARAWHGRLETFLGGGGCDPLDAALAVLEDHRWRVAHPGQVRVAINGDSRATRPHRADTIDSVDVDSFGDDDDLFG